VHNIFSPLKVLDGKFQTDDVVLMHAYPLLPAMGLACPGIDARLHRMGLPSMLYRSLIGCDPFHGSAVSWYLFTSRGTTSFLRCLPSLHHFLRPEKHMAVHHTQPQP
jgi:hypothetical protein